MTFLRFKPGIVSLALLALFPAASFGDDIVSVAGTVKLRGGQSPSGYAILVGKSGGSVNEDGTYQVLVNESGPLLVRLMNIDTGDMTSCHVPGNFEQGIDIETKTKNYWKDFLFDCPGSAPGNKATNGQKSNTAPVEY